MARRMGLRPLADAAALALEAAASSSPPVWSAWLRPSSRPDRSSTTSIRCRTTSRRRRYRAVARSAALAAATVVAAAVGAGAAALASRSDVAEALRVA